MITMDEQAREYFKEHIQDGQVVRVIYRGPG